MKSLYLSITSLFALFSLAFTAPQQVPITGSIPFTFRAATLDDVDDLTTVFLDAFRRAPSWRYIRQFDDLYPNYTWNCQREDFKQIVLNTSDELGPVVTKVISVPDQSSHRKERVVSISIWELRLLHQATDMYPLSTSLAGLGAGFFSRPTDNTESLAAELGLDCKARLNMNLTRLNHFHSIGAAAEEKYLTKPYPRQFILSLLATHPDWDGNGFAARHIHWGKKVHSELSRSPEYSGYKLPITLMATPAGYPLYVSEGFEGLANITVERLDGEGILWIEAMKYTAKDE